MDEKKEVRKIKSVKLIKDLPGIKWGQTIDGDYAIYTFISESLNSQSFSREIIVSSPGFFKVEYEEEEEEEKRTVMTLEVELPDKYISHLVSIASNIRCLIINDMQNISKAYSEKYGSPEVELISSQPAGRIRVERYLDKRVLQFIKTKWNDKMKYWNPKSPGTVSIPSEICEDGFRTFLSDTTSTFEQQMAHVNYYRAKFEGEDNHSINLSIKEGAAYKNFLQKVVENME